MYTQLLHTVLYCNLGERRVYLRLGGDEMMMTDVGSAQHGALLPLEHRVNLRPTAAGRERNKQNLSPHKR